MAKWQIALALLVAAVVAHVLGVARQIRHYRQVFGELAGRWKGAQIGVGEAKSGVVAIVVVDRAGVVQAVRVRQWRGLFGRFLPRDEFRGLDIGVFRSRIAEPGMDALVGDALAQALAQLDANDASNPDGSLARRVATARFETPLEP